MIDPFAKVSVPQSPINHPDSTTDSADLSTTHPKCNQAIQPNETGTMNPSETRAMNPQYSKTGFGKDKLPTYPDTPEKVKQFIDDYATLDKQALIERYAPNWSTLKTWAHRLGAKRGEVFHIHHNGGRPSDIAKEVKTAGTQMVTKIKVNNEIENDPIISELVAEFQQKLLRVQSTKDAYDIQPLLVKLQGLLAARGAKTYAQLFSSLSEYLGKVLLMRRVEAETPIKQSLRFQYEQAMGFWIGMVREVATEEQWILLRALMIELSTRAAAKHGIVVNAQVINNLRSAGETVSPTN